jgi:16S rRNA (cytosine967-C5)-methyltransferase
VNTLKAQIDEVMDQVGGLVPTPYAPNGLRSAEPFNVEQHPAHHAGLVEVQDEGSQLACLACEAAPGMTVVDLCAGAGGKTLALAAAMANRGRLIAADTNRDRLDRLAPRAERAGVSIVERVLLNPGKELVRLADLIGRADLVLVDAPCSGTGTWRRNPEARWRLTPHRLQRLTSLQARLLDIAAALVRPGGRLVYVVCSLLPEEGDAQVDAFLAANPTWRPAEFALPTEPAAVSRAVLSPARHGTDGFFIAGLRSI